MNSLMKAAIGLTAAGAAYVLGQFFQEEIATPLGLRPETLKELTARAVPHRQFSRRK